MLQMYPVSFLSYWFRLWFGAVRHFINVWIYYYIDYHRLRNTYIMLQTYPVISGEFPVKLVQVMAWCRQATSYNLCQWCWSCQVTLVLCCSKTDIKKTNIYLEAVFIFAHSLFSDTVQYRRPILKPRFLSTFVCFLVCTGTLFVIQGTGMTRGWRHKLLLPMMNHWPWHNAKFNIP